MTFTSLVTASLLLSVIILLRYALVAGLFYWALWLRPPEKVKARALYKTRPPTSLMWSEIRWSAWASIIYAVPGAYMLEAWQHGQTAIYTEVSDFGWLYLPVSLFVYLAIHDTYFYWTHRLMHHPKLFPIFHKVHHDSLTPTPWAAFSFHPYESVVGALIIPLLAFFIPIHIGMVLVLLTLMTVCSVINHAGYEIFPDRWIRGFLGRHCITAAHHNLHHARFRYNYALYFRFWDKVMGTDVMEEAYDFLK